MQDSALAVSMFVRIAHGMEEFDSYEDFFFLKGKKLRNIYNAFPLSLHFTLAVKANLIFFLFSNLLALRLVSYAATI